MSRRIISSSTKVVAIIGDPIEHSITPRIQNFAWESIGANIVNVAFHVPEDNLTAAVAGAKASGLLGLMVTIPHKENVLSLCDELHESAQLMGAANLLHFRNDGKIVGHSSDGWAAIESLKENEVQVVGANIAIIGGGGAARSLALTFAAAGAKQIELLNRTVSRAETIAAEAKPLTAEVFATELTESTLAAAIDSCDLLVNATSVGMHPDVDASPVPSDLLRKNLAVYDIVYNPLQTRLLREAEAAGAHAIDGLGMLIYTNVYAARICAKLEISAATMRKEALLNLGVQ